MYYFALLALSSLTIFQGASGETFDSQNVVFVIVSQREPYHASMAELLRADIEQQVYDYEQRHPTVVITSDWRVPGAWRIVPLLRPLLAAHAHADWLLFLEPHTAVRYAAVATTLRRLGSNPGEVWFGYPLVDVEPTIIHHFATFDEFSGDEEHFTYPNFASGFAMSVELVRKLVSKLDTNPEPEPDFSIDPAFELARLVYGGRADPGPLLNGELSLCVVSAAHCTTYPKPFAVCGAAIPESSIYFAVKTWSGYHATRARVVRRTWGARVTNLEFFSDKADPRLPATAVGVANTLTGHCAKTIAILRHVTRAVAALPRVRWVLLADDDTILGVRRLTELLSCFRGGDSLTVLGERYGFGYTNRQAAEEKGFDYITGGGGVVLSVAAAARLARCECSSAAAPDDMTLGACAAHANISLTHSPLFHQARPQDYSAEYLARDRPVSFHKHWQLDPLAVYDDWFAQDDAALPRSRRDTAEL